VSELTESGVSLIPNGEKLKILGPEDVVGAADALRDCFDSAEDPSL